MKTAGPKRSVFLLFVLAALFGFGEAYYFYGKYHALKANLYAEAQKETVAIVFTVGKLIELPANETPVVATVSDKEKLRNQSFFQMAENGDILLAYNTAMKAILYRPATNKIINVALISSNQSEVLPSTEQVPAASSTYPRK